MMTWGMRDNIKKNLQVLSINKSQEFYNMRFVANTGMLHKRSALQRSGTILPNSRCFTRWLLHQLFT